MRLALGMIIGVALVVAAFLGFAYSGLYNVAATRPHTEVVHWALHTVAQRSIATRAMEDVQAVPNLNNQTRIAAGARHFREACVQCHGAPGATPSPVGKSLMPKPPDLAADSRHEWSPAEQFWIVKHGIKMTGMPAWGPSNPDHEIWDVVAFLRALPSMSADQYRTLSEQGEHKH